VHSYLVTDVSIAMIIYGEARTRTSVRDCGCEPEIEVMEP